MLTQTMDHFHQHIAENLREGINGDGEKVPYVIPSALDNYWTERRVDIILNSQQPPVASSPDMIISDFPRVFSILTHIGRSQEIEWLCSHVKGLDDSRLPFDETCFPPTCQWASDFLREQWMFIPLFFPPDKIFSRVVHPKTILPVTYKRQLTQRRGGRDTATLWEVQVHSGGSLTALEDQPVVFKVYEGAGTEDLYKAETDVYLKLRRKNNKYITKHLASFSFQGKRKYIIVLEYAAGGSLKDFFQNTLPPVSPNEFRLLWSRLLHLLDALNVLHDLYRPDGAPVWFLAGVHQDIQPANILVFPEKDKDSRFDVKFKLTDFGLAEIGRVSASGGKLATENRGNRMYISPESFANFSVQNTVRTDLPPTADIWALGAVFSDVLVWSICGEPGREEYRRRRRAEISSQRHMKERDHDACFHDGVDRLAAVEESHKLALQDKRGSDRISPYMSKVILDYMLTGVDERLTAMNIRIRAEREIKNMKEDSLDNDQAVSSGKPPQARHTSPSRRQTVPNPSLPRVSRVSNLGLPIQQQANHFCASPRTSLDQSTAGPSSPAPSVTQFTSPPMANGHVQMKTPNPPQAVVKVTVDEVYRMMEKTNISSFPTSIGMRPDKAKEIMKLPGMEEARIKIAMARGRDQIMLIDNFRSMGQHKPKVVKTARVISYVAKAVDEDGMELYAASEIAKKPRICKTSSQIEKAINKMPTVDGTCNMRGCLDTILDRVLVGRKVKPTSIYIYTDGVWEPGADQVKFSIKRAIDYLIKCKQPSSTLMFQFVQFGSDTEGTGRLKFLDNKCVREVETESYDIVDTKHCDDHVPNIVIGSFSRYADEVGSSEEVSKPAITEDKDVLIKVHAASINPVDVKKAAGVFKMAIKEEFPYKLGYDAAGVVVEVGKGVTRLKVGDEVYTRLPEAGRGAWSEFAKCPDHYVSLKPKSLSFADAASLPLAGVTALQVLGQYKGSLEDKTVFIPAGLSGTGAIACQLAKNVFHAGKVITTVSTSKIPKVAQLLGEGTVDQIIDYTKQKVSDAIPAKSVDFCFDTTGQAMEFLSLMVPSTGMIVSISTAPSASTLQASSVMRQPDNPRIPFAGRVFLDAADAIRRLRAWRWGVTYMYHFLDPNREDLDKLTGYVESGKVKPVVGAKIDMRDIKAVREACDQTYKGKGGLGKTVFEVIRD
ncbi:serine threonine kinase [Fusarium tjaetaba]|uniref:Serine threonine kinase n=1 Tax=Fusarium tjaetaba TaxID=1567544 RepID=A0A8H5RI70_9HYPO|nr:serine threonine kinase [Fusarium tjaetaba]KAF5633819.1 serine threonine kinase [Fusarium tjaetaba]